MPAAAFRFGEPGRSLVPCFASNRNLSVISPAFGNVMDRSEGPDFPIAGTYGFHSGGECRRGGLGSFS
jgi:hypothetical protein